MRKIEQAIKLMAKHPGLNRHQAAKAVGMSYSVLHRGLALREAKSNTKCPTCGRAGYKP